MRLGTKRRMSYLDKYVRCEKEEKRQMKEGRREGRVELLETDRLPWALYILVRNIERWPSRSYVLTSKSIQGSHCIVRPTY